MKILLDAMGGDLAPVENIKGAYEFSKETKYDVVLLGDKEKLNEVSLELYNVDIDNLSPRISVIHTTENIDPNEVPTVAIKKKKDSPIVKGLHELKEGNGDIFLSAGSTGALLTGAVLIVGRLKGINRPSLVPTFNLGKNKIFLSDSGANTTIRPINLLQFAQMASMYAEIVEGVENPKVMMLNNGAERNKGTDVHKEAYTLLEEETEKGNLNFKGNIEARDVFKTDANVIVTGGFEGNVLVKSIEGTLEFISDKINEKLNKVNKLFRNIIKKKIKGSSGSIDYKKWGGAVMLGIKNPVIKLHGSSDQTAFYYTLKQAEKILDSGYIEKFKEKME